MYVKIEENKACNKETAYIFTSKEELEKEDIQKEISKYEKKYRIVKFISGERDIKIGLTQLFNTIS